MTLAEQAETFERCMSVGGIAVFPADTVYGLACDAGNTGDVIRRLYALKRRPLTKPSAVMFFDLRTALAALPELGERTRAALEQLLPGQVTVLVPNPARRFPLACGEDPTTLGLRVAYVPALAGVRWPVLQSSANFAGGAEARTLAEVPERLRVEADLVIDGGELPGTPSTVVDLRAYERDRRWSIVRSGAVTEREVDAALHAQFHFDRRVLRRDDQSRDPGLRAAAGAARVGQRPATARDGSWNSAPEQGRRRGGCWPATARRRWSGSTSQTRCCRSPGRGCPPTGSRWSSPSSRTRCPTGRSTWSRARLAVHHLAPAEKRRLFERIRGALSPGRTVRARRRDRPGQPGRRDDRADARDSTVPTRCRT